MELHDTQTNQGLPKWIIEFDYPMELHDTQTNNTGNYSAVCLITLWNYTTLKPAKVNRFHSLRLITLWNYTTLKPFGYKEKDMDSLITLWNYTTLKPMIDDVETTPV